MPFNLFSTPTIDDIKVGYIDPTLGYVDDITICEANNYAKNNPGTTFIFRDGDNNVRYLNINEVNRLTPNDLTSNDDECGGIQNYSECKPPTIKIFGGGGVGAVANPVIGRDGSLLAVDLVSGGHGYQYPPFTQVVDDCQIGNGAVLTAVLGETVDEIEVYEGEEDFEEYQICNDDDITYGFKYGLNGEEIGEWEPSVYTRVNGDPIRREVEIFQKLLKNPFWTTRDKQPDRIATPEKEYPTQTAYNVTFPAWGDFMNQYAISPVKPSDTTGTDESGKIFTIEWEINFPITGEYIFKGSCDNISQVYIDDSSVGSLGGFNQAPAVLQKTVQEGNHVIRIDLLNLPVVTQVQTSTTATSSVNLKPKFVQKGSNFYLQVDGDGTGEISFIMDVDDNPSYAGLAAKEVHIPSDGGKVKLKREGSLQGQRREGGISGEFYREKEIVKGSGTFSGGRKYGPIEIIGAGVAARGISPIKGTSNRLEIRDADGNDANIKVLIGNKSSKNSTSKIEVGEVVSPKSWNENPMGVSLLIEAPKPPIPKEQIPPPIGECPPNPIWTTRFPGSSQQWYPVNFPSILVSTEIAQINEPVSTQTNTQTVAKKNEEVTFSINEAGSDNSSIEIIGLFTADKDDQISKKVEVGKVYQVVAKPSNRKLKSDGKVLRLEDSTDNDFNDLVIRSTKGKFYDIKGNRCKFVIEITPSTGTTGSPNINVRTSPGWSKFMNRYAISPVLPLETPGSDSSGVAFSNSWDIDLPYSGFYGVRGTGDNSGRILIDGREVYFLSGFSTENPRLTKIFLTKGKHTITTEITNQPVNTSSVIDQKIFSTQDWRTEINTSQSSTKNGVSYSGPSLTSHRNKEWSRFMNDFSVSPIPVNQVGIETLLWRNVNFPQDGTYKFNFQADNVAKLKVGGREIFTTSDFKGEKIQYTFNATAGNYDILIELENVKNPRNDVDNPRGVALYISKDITFEENNKVSWKENPIGVSAILIPPPCSKKIGGKGVVEKIIPIEPGNGYPNIPSNTPGYNVQLILDEVITVDSGINYNCGEDVIKIIPDNGAKLSYTCDSYGRIVDVKVEVPGDPFTVLPVISIEPPQPTGEPTGEPTGVNAKFVPVFRVVRDPISPEVTPETLIQVTDLVGLKQTGYVEGRPYYGAVYYDNGLPYAGYYRTAGPQTRVYATLQESITSQVTTPASAIQRSGTDITNNDPNLNIPGTPQSTTEQ